MATLAALLFAEPEAATIAERLKGARLAAPILLSYAMSNVCLTKIRRLPSQRDSLRTAFGLASRLRIDTVAVDHATLNRAETTGLTVYDASYLWLARALCRELVTLDRTLSAAAV